MCDPIKEISTGLTDLAKVTGTKAIGDSIAEGDLSKIGDKLSNDLSSTVGNTEWLKGAALVGVGAFGALWATGAFASGGVFANTGAALGLNGGAAATTAGAGSVSGASTVGLSATPQGTMAAQMAAGGADAATISATMASPTVSGAAGLSATQTAAATQMAIGGADAASIGSTISATAPVSTGAQIANAASSAGNYAWNAAKGAYELVANASPTTLMAVGQGINSGLTYMTEQDKLAQAEKQQKDLMALEEQRRKSAATTVSTSGLLSRQMNANLGRA